MQKLILAVAILLFGYSTSAQNTNQLVKDYVAIKNALVNSDGRGASQAALTFQKTLTEDTDFTQKKDLLKAARALSEASGIDKQRTIFNELSTTLWKVVKNTEKVDDPVYYQYCPMKKAYWLSDEKEIKNPYYGTSMLTCGKIVETK